VASAWNDISTETRGLTGPGIPDTGDLIVRLGRLAFASPQWTPPAPSIPRCATPLAWHLAWGSS
jgi:hypothetical protein